jgi:hypothetical protein
MMDVLLIEKQKVFEAYFFIGKAISNHKFILKLIFACFNSKCNLILLHFFQ